MSTTEKPRYAVVIGWYRNNNDATTRAELAEKKGLHAVVVDTQKADVDFPDPVREIAEVITGKMDELIRAVMTRDTAAQSADPGKCEIDPGKPEVGKILFGSFLKMYRKGKIITQDAFGERIGISGATIAKWEAGGRLTRPMLAALKVAMNDVPQDMWENIYVPLSCRYGTNGAER